jgi:hypothetical protein
MLSAYNKDDMIRLMRVLGLSEISKIKNPLDILNLLNLKERGLGMKISQKYRASFTLELLYEMAVPA